MRNCKRFALKRKVLFIRTAAILLPLVSVLLLLSQPAFAKNTYVITDGTRVITYTTTATDPETVLGEAGLELDENDTYTTQSRLGTSEITVRRSQTIHIDLYGREMTATSHGETVAELLHRLNINIGEQDVLSRDLNDATYDGLKLRIDRVIRQDQTYTSTIPHGTSYYYDATLPEGMQELVAEGVDGEILYTAEVIYINGEETSREVLSEVMTIPAVDEVIAVGTGLAAEEGFAGEEPIITDNMIILPTGEVLTYTDSKEFVATAYTHTDAGCDFITATGTTVRVGTVAVDPRYIPYGTRMFIMTSDGSYIYGISVAEDCGGAIKGDRLDLYMPTYYECIQFGIQDCMVYFLG